MMINMQIETTHKILRCLIGALGLCLMISAMTSCAYDYFEDENNFRLYVPQIKKGEIENLYIAIHDASGRHIMTRELNAPFDKDDLMKQGILRFKLPYGRDYTISCIADYASDATNPGKDFVDSYLKETLINGANVYASSTTNPRSFLSSATVYPIGHPESGIARIVNIDEKQKYKGKVKINFKDLPAIVSRIDVYYKGLATKYYFDGTFTQFSPNDLILASFNVADHTSGNTVSLTNILNPSAGAPPFGIMAPLQPVTTRALPAPQGAPLELEIRLFNSSGVGVGVISFTTNDFSKLKTTDPSKVPTAEDGSELSHLVLESQKTIIFNFKGFTIVSIELIGWGDLISGGTTPM